MDMLQAPSGNARDTLTGSVACSTRPSGAPKKGAVSASPANSPELKGDM